MLIQYQSRLNLVLYSFQIKIQFKVILTKNFFFDFINFNQFFQLEKFVVSRTSPSRLESCFKLPSTRDWNRTMTIVVNGCGVFFSGKHCDKLKSPNIFCSEKLRFNDVYVSKPTSLIEKNLFGRWYGFFICLVNSFFQAFPNFGIMDKLYFEEVEIQKVCPHRI